VALVPGQQRTLNTIKQMRAHLASELADVVNTFGPQMYDDFDQYRMLPASRPPPSADASADLLRRRKGSSAHAEPNPLLHPMVRRCA
jgi:glycerol-3-phosphate O-acyltransferase/dihydroxyacetone phosphate acyltransferase